MNLKISEKKTFDLKLGKDILGKFYYELIMM